jgi:hypothetical protein
MSTAPRKYLVIVRVGDLSIHKEWLTPESDRNFDLFVSYYGDNPGRYADTCDLYEQRKGPKYIGLSEWMQELGERVFEYDAVWLPDDDIQTDATNISRMFDLFNEHKLMLAQPALTQNAFFQVTVQHIGYLLRYTDFVEAMVPIFSAEALRICLPTFSKSITGWGLEHVWAKLLDYPKRKLAILDAVPVKHTRPPGKGDLYDNIKKQYKIRNLAKTSSSLLREFNIVAPKPKDITFYDGIKLWDPSAEPYKAPVSEHRIQRVVRERRMKAKKKIPGARIKKIKRQKAPKPMRLLRKKPLRSRHRLGLNKKRKSLKR